MPHIHEKIDFTVEVLIVHENQVLLRKHDKYRIWLGVGGHVELDEDPNQAAIREVKEEVGLDIKLFGYAHQFKGEGKDYHELIPPMYLNRHRINPTHEHVTLWFFAKSDTNEIRQQAEEMSEECKWFTKEELESGDYGIRDSIKHYAIKALETVT